MSATHTKRLPTVGAYCRSIGLKLTHYAEWKRGKRCPFCESEKGFLIRCDSGAFKCHDCGAKGNGIIKLHMQLHGVSEVQARAELARMAEVQS